MAPDLIAVHRDRVEESVDLEQLDERDVSQLVHELAQSNRGGGPATPGSWCCWLRIDCSRAATCAAGAARASARRGAGVCCAGQRADWRARPRRGGRTGGWVRAVARQRSLQVSRRRASPVSTALAEGEVGEFLAVAGRERSQLGAPQRHPVLVQGIETPRARREHPARVAGGLAVHGLCQPAGRADQRGLIAPVPGGRLSRSWADSEPCSAANRPASSRRAARPRCGARACVGQQRCTPPAANVHVPRSLGGPERSRGRRAPPTIRVPGAGTAAAPSCRWSGPWRGPAASAALAAAKSSSARSVGWIADSARTCSTTSRRHRASPAAMSAAHRSKPVRWCRRDGRVPPRRLVVERQGARQVTAAKGDQTSVLEACRQPRAPGRLPGTVPRRARCRSRPVPARRGRGG